MRRQLALDRPTSKRLWTNIVRAKIQNQADCLELSGNLGAEYLRAIAQKVRSGDPDNLEGLASAFYFRNLFDKHFTRSTDTRVNSALNYGYAIIRGAIARILVSHGFLPAFGIHHHSEQNAFNLADDLIEPFRPLVDLFVRVNFRHESRALDSKDKASLVELLHFDMGTEDGASTVLVCIEKCVTSLARVLEHSNSELISIPKLTPLRVHENEC
jgi:CRISPR-associated protein Cas1